MTTSSDAIAAHNVHTLFPAATESVQSRFEEVWRLWPSKAKKPLARAKYEALLRGPFRTKTFDKDSGGYVDIELSATEDQIVAGIKAYLDSQIDRKTYKMRDDGKYVPHLATFLNQGRFLDLLP